MSQTIPNPRRWAALALLCAAQFIVILDTSIVGVALPAIQADLGFSDAGLSWIFNAYVIAFGGLLLMGGKVGDIFTVTITNNGKMNHSMDFHASKVAWSDEMQDIAPGESRVYQFEAKHAGIWMYHCGTSPALHHIGNGMFGAVVIDPPNLPPVDHEFIFVQSEIYTGPMGEPGDLGKMQNEQHDAVVFNGYVNQYKHAPIRVEPNERVRAWVLDAGPSENSAFHIVGTIFDTVYKEGTLLLSPDGRQGGSQALDLQPSQGGYVEFSFDEAGLYLMVTHKFANVGKGALGIFQAAEVDMAGVGGHRDRGVDAVVGSVPAAASASGRWIVRTRRTGAPEGGVRWAAGLGPDGRGALRWSIR